MKPIKIIWVDAESLDEWTDVADLDLELPDIISVGLLVQEDGKAIQIALNYDSTNNRVSCIMTIPQAWIKSKVYLD